MNVSIVANILRQAGLIRYSRGHIRVLSLDGLKDCSCECYQTLKSFSDRLLVYLPKFNCIACKNTLLCSEHNGRSIVLVERLPPKEPDQRRPLPDPCLSEVRGH